MSGKMFESRTLSVSIACPPARVQEFASNPENLPKWAEGLGKTIRKNGNAWIVDTPQGPAEIRFADENGFGVLDHFVKTASGIDVYVPMRVMPNGTGSEVVFTIYRNTNASDEEFAEDAKLVGRDLLKLKTILEIADEEKA